MLGLPRNHFHLAIDLGEPNLSDGMKWFKGTWIRRYSGYRKLVGRHFQGRYKALVVEPGHHFAQVCHHIHLNPVRARVVKPSQAAVCIWGSRLVRGSLLDRSVRPEVERCCQESRHDVFFRVLIPGFTTPVYSQISSFR